MHAIEESMPLDKKSLAFIGQAEDAALHILLHNAHGP
jgi:hypothetical protein